MLKFTQFHDNILKNVWYSWELIDFSKIFNSFIQDRASLVSLILAELIGRYYSRGNCRGIQYLWTFGKNFEILFWIKEESVFWNKRGINWWHLLKLSELSFQGYFFSVHCDQRQIFWGDKFYWWVVSLLDSCRYSIFATQRPRGGLKNEISLKQLFQEVSWRMVYNVIF